MSKAIQPGFLSRNVALCLCWAMCLGIPVSIFGQTNYYRTNGTEYAVVDSLPGDQVFPAAALTSGGGFVVWQDNITDGSGWGISARRLDGTLSGTLSTFRVNSQGADDQTHPRVALLSNGGAVFVWQGGKPSGGQIYARFLTSSDTWLTTNDLLVASSLTTNVFSNYGYATNQVLTITTNWNHSHTVITGYATNTTTTVATNVITTTNINTGDYQISPAVATLSNGNVVVVWAGFSQASPGNMLDVYGQVLTPAGQKVGGAFLVNQFTNYNQRTPAVAGLNNGGFVVAWVSEQQRAAASAIDNAFYGAGGATYVSTNEAAIGANNNTNYFFNSGAAPTASVDVYARLYSSGGVALGNEFLVDLGSNPCANPAVAVASDGTFMVAWSALDQVNPSANGWDVYARVFSNAGIGGTTLRVNSYISGNQYIPQICAIGLDYLIVWTSLDQDGSLEGVFGQFVHANGAPVNSEFRVNTTTLSRQMQPAVASDGVGQFLVAWTGYNVTSYNFDLYAQRYADVNVVLSPMAAPFVYTPYVVSNGVYQPQLQVSWPLMQGISVSAYEVYVDGATTPMASTTNNVWTMTSANGLTADSTHSFQLDYVTTDGRRPLISPPASGTTWDDCNWYGIPCKWMIQYYGNNAGAWPLPTVDTDGDGTSTLQEFLAGTIPTNSASVLRMQIGQTPPGSQPGQVQQAGQSLFGMYLSWNTQPGLTYQVQMTTDFKSWSNLPPPNDAPRFATGSTDSIYVGGGSAAYFRVVLLRQ